MEVFTDQWTGELILITSQASLTGKLAKFDFSWFVPNLVKYRKLLGEVLVISFMRQLFGLISPLFFQVVMDKVLVHKGMTTLDVLVIGLVVVVIFGKPIRLTPGMNVTAEIKTGKRRVIDYLLSPVQRAGSESLR